MEFIKKNWSTLILVSLVAAYIGISMGTNGCPMCAIFRIGSDDSRVDVITAVDSNAIPDWNATLLDGTPISSISEKGKVCLLVFWATWCDPCLEEIPDLIALRNEFSNEDVSIMGISVDSPGKDLLPFVANKGINYKIVRQSESLETALGPIRYIPTMFIVDQQGQIRHQHTGVVSKNSIHAQIQTLLDSEPQS